MIPIWLILCSFIYNEHMHGIITPYIYAYVNAYVKVFKLRPRANFEDLLTFVLKWLLDAFLIII